MLTVRDIAEDLQLAPDTISQKLKSGEIPGGTRLFGGRWRVDPTTYAAFKASLTAPYQPGDAFTARSPRSEAARRAANNRK